MMRTSSVVAVLAVIAWITAGPAAVAAQEAVPKVDQCVACHSDPDFLVTNKKLYDYFQNWRSSVHGLDDVTCTDCHEGNADISDQAAAHGSMMVSDPQADAVSYRQVPATCGACHEEELKSYQTSRHYQLMETRQQADRGPNCVTCHGSLNAQAPTVRTVAGTCQHCHNSESNNHPDMPVQAEKLLNDFNTVRGFRHYVDRRGEGELRATALSDLDSGLGDLTRHWHTFDLESISTQTDELLALAKAKYEAVRESRRAQKTDN
jgi:hypothetical protein